MLFDKKKQRHPPMFRYITKYLEKVREEFCPGDHCYWLHVVLYYQLHET